MKVIILALLVVLTTPLVAKELYVVASGFSSCNFFKLHTTEKNGKKKIISRYAPTPFNKGTYKKFLETVGPDSPYIFSCFSGLIGEEELYYITSDDPQESRKIEISSFYELVEDFYNEKRDKENLTGIKIWGHSHGGWLALQTILHKGDRLPFDGAMTVDPISHELCTRQTLMSTQLKNLKKIAAWPFWYSYKLKECVQRIRSEYKISNKDAINSCKNLFKEELISTSLKSYFKKLYSDPKDICLKKPEDINGENVRKNVSYWINYFQNKSFFLHSSAFTSADENIFLEEKNHLSIDTDDEIWNRFSNNF